MGEHTASLTGVVIAVFSPSLLLLFTPPVSRQLICGLKTLGHYCINRVHLCPPRLRQTNDNATTQTAPIGTKLSAQHP